MFTKNKPVVCDQVVVLLDKYPSVIDRFQSDHGRLRPVYAAPFGEGELTSADVRRLSHLSLVSTFEIPQYAVLAKGRIHPVMYQAYQGSLQSYLFRFLRTVFKQNTLALDVLVFGVGLLNIFFLALLFHRIAGWPATILSMFLLACNIMFFIHVFGPMLSENIASIFMLFGCWLVVHARERSQPVFFYLGCFLFGAACFQKLPIVIFVALFGLVYYLSALNWRNALIGGLVFIFGYSPSLASLFLGFQWRSRLAEDVSGPFSVSILDVAGSLVPFLLAPRELFLHYFSPGMSGNAFLFVPMYAVTVTTGFVFFYVKTFRGKLKYARRNEDNKKLGIFVVSGVLLTATVLWVSGKAVPYYFNTIIPFIYLASARGLLVLFERKQVNGRMRYLGAIVMLFLVISAAYGFISYLAVSSIYEKNEPKNFWYNPTSSMKLANYLMDNRIEHPITLKRDYVGLLEFLSEGRINPRHYWPMERWEGEKTNTERILKIMRYEKQGILIRDAAIFASIYESPLGKQEIKAIRKAGWELKLVQDFVHTPAGEAFELYRFQKKQ